MGRYLDRLKKLENGPTPYLENQKYQGEICFLGALGTPPPPFQKIAYAGEPANDSPNAPKVVPTAHIKPASWLAARDAYYGHLFTCAKCRPTGLCSQGTALKQQYNEEEKNTVF